MVELTRNSMTILFKDKSKRIPNTYMNQQLIKATLAHEVEYENKVSRTM